MRLRALALRLFPAADQITQIIDGVQTELPKIEDEIRKDQILGDLDGELTATPGGPPAVECGIIRLVIRVRP
jgi:hypothetical protein